MGGETITRVSVNNEIYKSYGDRWYTADDDPVAILRAEARIKLPWVLAKIQEKYPTRRVSVLDIGCGGGFLSNPMAAAGHDVTGVDLAPDSLAVASRFDQTRRVKYVTGDAYHLPFADGLFDVVTQMDMLEHLEDPARAVREASRMLKPGGLYLVQTLNRNWLSGLIAIKLIEWLVAGTPDHLHLLRLFIKPSELKTFCDNAGLQMGEMVGIRPRIRSIPLKNIFIGIVPESLEFALTRSTLLSYMGSATKHFL